MRSSTFRLFPLAVATTLAAAVLLTSIPLTAQEADPDDLVVDEIVVTAQKREENLQDVPIAITAFSALEIEEAGIDNTEDLLGLTSNITLGNSFTVGNSFITVRGLSQINNSDQPVAVVIDGVYQANQKQFTQELFDIERVEVLKGPQGALYGRNSLGGAINIITKQPSNELEGFLTAGAGDANALRLAASVSGSLVEDKVLFRAAGSFKEDDGRITNVFLDEKADPFEDTTTRLHLKFLPSDSLTLDLRGQVSDTEGGAVLYALLPTDGGANNFDIQPDENILGFSERDVTDASFRLEWVGDTLGLTAITGYTEVEETYRGDLDFSNPVRFPGAFPLGQGQDLDVSYLSQEIRLTSADDAAFRWIAGAYYLETDRGLTTIPFLDTDGTIAGFVPLFFIGEDNDNTAYAGFGQLDFDLGANDNWGLSLGARYDKDEREQVDTINGGDRQRSFDDVQPRVSLRYSSDGNVMGYATLARGFRSGGYNAPVISPDFFREETTDNIEVGFKSTLANGRVRFNGAAYVTSVDNFQFFQVDILTASQIISNINEVEMQGLELDVLALVRSGWSVFGSVGFNDSEIDDFDGTGRFIGNQTPNNVRFTSNLGTQFSRPITDSWAFIGRIDVELRGKQYWHPDNLDVQDDLTFLNARVSFDNPRWSFTLWGKNLNDEEFYAEYFDATWGGIPSGMDLGHLGRPQSVGVDVRWRF